MTTVNTEVWGELSYLYITQGPGAGEVHVCHDGSLSSEGEAMNSIAATFRTTVIAQGHSTVVFKFGRTSDLELVAENLLQAIASAAARRAQQAQQAPASPLRTQVRP